MANRYKVDRDSSRPTILDMYLWISTRLMLKILVSTLAKLPTAKDKLRLPVHSVAQVSLSSKCQPNLEVKFWNNFIFQVNPPSTEIPSILRVLLVWKRFKKLRMPILPNTKGKSQLLRLNSPNLFSLYLYNPKCCWPRDSHCTWRLK